MRRKKNILTVTCTPAGVITNHQTLEEIETMRRRREFFKCGGTAELYLFSMKLKKEIEEFKSEQRCKLLKV